jgi:hypothetical protein
MDRIASEVNQHGADELILSTEAWEAEAVGKDDPRASLRATEREDRRESFLTHVVERGGRSQTWRSLITRTEDAVRLGDVEDLGNGIPTSFRPIIEAWAEWAPPA